MNPKYSICLCVKNMANTIETAIISIAQQIDERFEIVVVDDNSTDKTIEKLEGLANVYSNIKYKTLHKDNRRWLGETRNESARYASGEYLLFQFDCDDFYPNLILDFVNVYHQIENVIGDDFYLFSDFHMTKKSFIMPYGPYPNTFAEDYYLPALLINDGKFVYLSTSKMKFHLPVSLKKILFKLLYRKSWLVLRSRFRQGIRWAAYCKWEISRCFDVYTLYQLILSVPAYFISKTFDPLDKQLPIIYSDPKVVDDWIDSNRISLEDLMKKNNKNVNWDDFSYLGKRFFGEPELYH